MDLKLKTIITTVLLVAGMASSQAALINRGGGLIYDDVLDVTWMQDAQYSATADGIDKRNWVEALQWADQLEYYDPVRNVVWNDWRLPSTINDLSSVGWDPTGESSEMAYMYYVNLGYEANMSLDPSDPLPQSDNYNPFFNLSYRGYWSGTGTGTRDSDKDAWYFHMHFGYQDINSGLGDELRMWALRDGDVSAVPIPPSLLLMVSGLLGIFGAGASKTRRRLFRADI